MKRILVPVDGTDRSLAAVRAAVAEGRGRIDRIDLVHVAPALTRHAARFVSRRERERWRDEQASAAFGPARRLVEASGIACRTHVVRGRLARAVAEAARHLGTHEIVVAATRRGPFAQFLANTLGTRLLDEASVPVRLVPAASASPFERFAVPTGVGVGFALLVLAIED